MAGYFISLLLNTSPPFFIFSNRFLHLTPWPHFSVSHRLSHLFVPQIILARLKPSSTLSASLSLSPPTTPVWFRPRSDAREILSRCLRGCLAGAALLTDNAALNVKNNAISSSLLQRWNAWIYRQTAREGKKKKKIPQTFPCLTCLTFFSELVNTECFVRTAWREMQAFCACHGEGFCLKTLHILHMDTHQ